MAALPSMGVSAFLEKHMLTCPSKAWLHMECPGCGLQRSFISLLRGDLKNSFELHPATIPMIALILIALLHLFFRFRYGAKLIIIFQFIVAIITVTFYIYKITHHKIFT